MNPVLQAVLIGLPATGLGLLAYLRSRKVDAVAEQSGIVTENRAGTEQIIQGLNQLVTNLQFDNNVFRQDLKDVKLQLAEMRADLGKALREIDRLRRKYGDEDSPMEPHP